MGQNYARVRHLTPRNIALNLARAYGRLMRTRFIYLFSSVLLAAAVGCGDDGKAIGTDAATCTPVNDNNACTTDVCQNNQPVHNPVAAGTACTGGACDATGNCVQAVCGDGTVQAGEMCDDGNKTNDDGCDDGAGGTCRPTGCGNGVKTGTEACDDGNATNGDGCDNNCKATACGNGVTTSGETCDDGNTAATDGCNTTCQTEAGYSCTAAVPSVCTLLCGNNVVDAGETCDDGNHVNLDGCGANCRLEAAEVEPNEDGTTATGGSGTAGNDFDTGGLAVTNSTNQGVILASAGSTNRLAAIDPAGDEDVFAISNDTTGPVELKVDIWNRATGFGFGVACGSSIDTGLNIRDAAGVVLLNNDDRDGSADRCSTATYMLAAGAVVYAHVVEFGDNATIPTYAVAVDFVPVVCGDTRVVAGFEECDDGNTTANDGCSAMCKIEGTDETEPNEDGTPSTGGSGIAGNDFDAAGGVAVTNSTNQGVRDIAMGGRTWLAAITAAGDEDVFAITNGGVVPYEVVINVWDPAAGVGNACADIDTGLNVRKADGSVEKSNDDRISGDGCSAATIILAAGQSRYLHVTEFGDNAVIAKYALEVVRREITCGDGHVVAGVEACDDGNTTAGDGCSAACVVEANYECTGEPSICALPPFASTTLACLDMAGATEVQPAGDDDEFTATAALPFSFNLYGTTMTHFATSSNGFAAFFANAAGSITSSSASNATTVPAAGTPNGYLAPFWDDLVLGTNGLRSKLTGTAGTRIFTFEWDADIYNTDGHVVVQLQLFEAGGVEYHYCSGTGAAARIAGSSATIAAENATGSVGHAFSINAESITQGTSALRWVFP